MNPTIIGISGKKKSGKNTVAKFITLHAACKAKEYAFADELKVEVARICNVSVSHINENKDTYRHLLQAWGIYRRDTKGKDYWVKKVMEQVYRDALTKDIGLLIITDVRFKNEFNALNEAGAVLIRVSRNTGVIDTHSSETELDDVPKWHSILLNTGTLEHLSSDVKELLQQLKIQTK